MDIFENMEQQNPMVLVRDTLDHLFIEVVVEVKLEPGAKLPTKAHAWDAGFDLYTPRSIYLAPGTAAAIDTGVHMCIPHGFVGMIKSKSGLNVKHGVSCEGVIDAGYTGTIVAKLYNNGSDPVSFTGGDKVTQIVILPIPEVELMEVRSFEETERGDNGFGSSGR